jgi:hypothetical protein
MAEWDALRMYLPDMGNGSQIIVSTQHFDIASLCTGQPHKVAEFRKFTPDHSVCVFFKEVRNYVARLGRDKFYSPVICSFAKETLLSKFKVVSLVELSGF